METNRVTIVVDDGAVVTDICSYTMLDFAACGIPSNIHALQFLNGIGHIEFRGGGPNQVIETLPIWAVNCLSKWEEAFLANPPESEIPITDGEA